MAELTRNNAPSWRNIIFVITTVAALFVVPVALRLALFDPNNTIGFNFADLKGVGVDTALVCVALLLVVWALPTWGARITVPLLGLHLLIQVANAEFAWVFGRALEFSQIGYMANATFFWGSATTLRNPELFFVSIGLVAIIGFTIRGTSQKCMMRVFSLSGFSAALLFVSVPTNPDLAAWRTSGFLNQNGRSAIAMFKGQLNGEGQAELSVEIAQLKQELGADLSGNLWAVQPIDKPNILMVVLESVSAAYLPSVVQTQGLYSNVKMKNVDSFVQRGSVFSQFFAHQRQTTRGTYALLCGQLPRFSSKTPKLEVAASQGQALDCLPTRLAAAGYATEYLQAAPLSFSKKDQSLPLIGYQTLNGANSFSAEDVGSAWGVNDHILFARAAERVRSLAAASQPWFLTVLNVGTHHPFDIVPSSFVGSDDPKIRSFEYLDAAFGEFVDELERKGLLEDTIVIVVSDESGGLVGPSASAVAELARNWGVFAVVGPDWIEPRQIDTVAGQLDLPLSISDLLGLKPASGFGGRSVFRDYKEPRNIYAFNNIGDFTYAISNEHVDMCQLGEDRCQTFRRVDGKMGDLLGMKTAPTVHRKANALTVLTNHGVDDLHKELLAANSMVEVSESTPYLICCQYLSIPSKAQLNVEMDLELITPGAASIYVDIISQKDGQFTTHFEKTYDLSAGENIKISIERRFVQNADDVEVRVRLNDTEASKSFTVYDATLSISK